MTPSVNLGALMQFLPALIIALGAVILVLADALVLKRSGIALAGIALAATFAAFVAQVMVFPREAQSAFSGALEADGYSALVSLAVLLVLGMTLVLTPSYFTKMRAAGREHYALLLISALGMMLLPCARELVSLVVCIELISIPLYVLAGYNRSLVFSGEAALKYFILGAFASAFIIYGAAFIYGTTGSLYLNPIAGTLPIIINKTSYSLGLGCSWSASRSRPRWFPSTPGCPTRIREAPAQSPASWLQGLSLRSSRCSFACLWLASSRLRNTGAPPSSCSQSSR